MSNDISVHVEDLSKAYQVYSRPEDRLKQFLYPRLQRLLRQNPQSYYQEFWALRDISFNIHKGETVGVIGRNGSGKSTLLQLICGILHPTYGIVETYGRVAALLELGSGFNPEFTGRENVYMNAAILGLTSEEVDFRFDDIASFADVGDSMDQPTKHYSSGMVLRLAFAVQSQIEPDILIVDEALAVGDVKFQTKCFDRLKQLKKNGTSILLVTHSVDQIVTHCDKAILLEDGIPLEMGEPKRVTNRYMDLLFGKEKKIMADKENQPKRKFSKKEIELEDYELSFVEDNFSKRQGYNPHEYRWGDGAAAILDFYLAKEDELYPRAVRSGQTIRLGVSIRFHTKIYRPILGVTIKTKEGFVVYGANSEMLKLNSFMQFGESGSVLRAEIEFICRLVHGDYFISLGVASKQGGEVVPHDRRFDSVHLHVLPDESCFGLVDLKLQMKTKEVTA